MRETHQHTVTAPNTPLHHTVNANFGAGDSLEEEAH
jgi:hypothetical protein